MSEQDRYIAKIIDGLQCPLHQPRLRELLDQMLIADPPLTPAQRKVIEEALLAHHP